MEAKSPKGVNAWLDLATKAKLPILKVSAQLLTKQIKSGASLADMAHTIERDPVLCLYLFSSANHKNANGEVEILSLNHVITMLGMNGVIDVIRQAPKMALLKSDARQKAYLQAQANSTLAGRLVEHWASDTHSGSAEKLKWATMLSGAPNWYLWFVAYQPMTRWQFAVHHDHFPSAKVEAKLFGCLLEDVSRMIGRRVRLPNLSQQLLERANWPTLREWGKILSPNHMMFSDEDTQLRRLKSAPSTLMLLMNHLAQQVQFGWMHPRCLRVQIALAHLSGKELHQVVKRNHNLAIDMSRKQLAEQILPPAVSLLWPTQLLKEPSWVRRGYICWEKDPASQASAKPKVQAERVLQLVDAPPRTMNKKILLEALEHLNQGVSEFNDIHNIFLASNKALRDGIGMGRGFISILNKTGDCLRPVYCFGIESDDPIRSMRIELKENRLFDKLMGKSASFRIDSNNVEQAINMLKPEVVKTLKRKNCMVMSVFSLGKPIGVVYADVSPQEQAISDTEYQAFKTVCQSTSRALEQYTKRKS
ncbi:hypothetical protein NBRC116188_15430 [Oceaniserpentilla sp. 4NH20-0058]|uniref:HDOD domain-containing protein n=1 Tax=Oceaniserpentilla sp. 4NH20-0058 TaxID=3127660 RepID=UPI003109EBD7